MDKSSNKNKNINKDEVGGKGHHPDQTALEASTELKRMQALKCLEKLIDEHQEFLQTKLNVHKEIKTKATSISNALRSFKILDEEWRVMKQRPPYVTPKSTVMLAPTGDQTNAGTATEMDTGAEADSDSVVEEKRDKRSAKRKQRTSPQSDIKQMKKKKDSGPSPSHKEVTQDPDMTTTDWKLVQSRHGKKKQREEQPPKQPLLKPKQKKPRRSMTRPNALIIRPNQKDGYADILCRIKKDVPDDQVRSTVDKIRKTATGDLLIILSKENTDKGQGLQKTIADLLKDDAKVISKGPQEGLEIRDLDDTTTKEDILIALQKAVGEESQIPSDAIRSLRNAYRGTQTALVTLAAPIAQKILGEHGKIRIGWVNCRIRAVERPMQCYKCWHFGHLAIHCKREVDRSQLCIKCGQGGHKVAACKNPARCALCAEQHSTENLAHHAGTSRCPAFKEALLKLKKKQA